MIVGAVRSVRSVSIHAPREGCDANCANPSFRTPCFNSRTPGGVRLVVQLYLRTLGMFQFTHPGRGATSP